MTRRLWWFSLTYVLVLFAASAWADCIPEANCKLNPMPPTQTIASGGIITADGCGGLKAVTAAGAVTTSTTNTFSAPGIVNKNCWMAVCNVGATNTITLDFNANFASAAAGDIALAAGDCVTVVSNGVTWRQVSALLDN